MYPDMRMCSPDRSSRYLVGNHELVRPSRKARNWSRGKPDREDGVHGDFQQFVHYLMAMKDYGINGFENQQSMEVI